MIGTKSRVLLLPLLVVLLGSIIQFPAVSADQAGPGIEAVLDLEPSPLLQTSEPMTVFPNTTLTGIRLDGGLSASADSGATLSVSPASPGTVTVYGRWLFYDSDYDPATQTGTIRPIRRAYAELWDSDAFSEVGPLATTNTGEDGFFYFPPVENTDGFLEGTLDVYVKLFLESSIVKVRAQCCAGPYQFTTPVFSNVPDGDFLVGHWHMVGSSRGAGSIFDTIEIGYDYASSFGHTHSKVTVIWPGPDPYSSYNEIDGVTINIAGGGGDQDEWDEDNILHEYGHSILFHVYGGWIVNSVGQYAWNECSNDNYAFSEGWPTFWAVAVNLERGYGDQLYPRDTWYRDDFTAFPLTFDLEANTGAGLVNPSCVSSTIATTLWDIYDVAVDGRDNLVRGMVPMWGVFANYVTPPPDSHHVYTIRQFWDGYFGRGEACQGCTSGQQIWGIYFDHGINMDSTPPTGSISINNGASSTTSSSVALTLTFGDALSGVSSVRYSNDGVFDNEPWEAPLASKAWTLGGGTGTKTVYYQIQDNAGLTSVFSDSIDVLTGGGGGGGPCRPGCPIKPSSTPPLWSSGVAALDRLTMTYEQRFSVRKIEYEANSIREFALKQGSVENTFPV